MLYLNALFASDVCYSANLMSSSGGGNFPPCKGTSDAQVPKPTKPTRFHETHETPGEPTESHENPRNPTIMDLIQLFVRLKTNENPRNPMNTYEVPPNPRHDHGFYTSFFNRLKTHENARNPRKPMESPMESHDHGFYICICYLCDRGHAFQLRLNMCSCGVLTRSQPHART